MNVFAIDFGFEAKKALDVAEVKNSGFRFHQDVGLVGKEHQETNVGSTYGVNTRFYV